MNFEYINSIFIFIKCNWIKTISIVITGKNAVFRFIFHSSKNVYLSRQIPILWVKRARFCRKWRECGRFLRRKNSSTMTHIRNMQYTAAMTPMQKWKLNANNWDIFTCCYDNKNVENSRSLLMQRLWHFERPKYANELVSIRGEYMIAIHTEEGIFQQQKYSESP